MVRLASSCAALLLLACQGDDLPPVQARGEFLSYAADDDVCDGTVEYGERWMLAVAARLGISPDEILPTTYYRLDPEDAKERCGAPGCTRRSEGEVSIFDATLLNKHELVHAIQLSAWPRRRPLLVEGLAMAFDDDGLDPFVWSDQFSADLDEQIEKDHAELDTYFVGAWIVYWVVQRHGVDAFRTFWYADTEGSSAEEFRVLFEQHFGESLDAMLADVAKQTACPLLTCVEDVVEWEGSLWTTESPTGCGDGLTFGSEATSDSKIMRTVLIDVPVTGAYTVSVSESELLGNQGTRIYPCGGPCRNAASLVNFYAGQSTDVMWEAGLYRVTTAKLSAEDPGVRVEIRPK